MELSENFERYMRLCSMRVIVLSWQEPAVLALCVLDGRKEGATSSFGWVPPGKR